MPPIQTKAQLVETLREKRSRLEKVLLRLTPDEIERPGACGEWSVKDILAHLEHWQRLNIGWLDAFRRGENPLTPAPGYTWEREDVDRLNRQIYEAHCKEPLDIVLADFRVTFEQFMDQLESISEADLFTPGFAPFAGEKATLVRWYTHYAFHDGWGYKQIYEALVRKPRKKKEGQ